MSDERLDRLAEDLAAWGDVTPDEATARIHQALRGDADAVLEPLRHVRRAPWWWRLPLPLLWKQRWVMRRLRKVQP